MLEFLNFKGYSSDPGSQVVMRDDSHTGEPPLVILSYSHGPG